MVLGMVWVTGDWEMGYVHWDCANIFGFSAYMLRDSAYIFVFSAYTLTDSAYIFFILPIHLRILLIFLFFCLYAAGFCSLFYRCQALTLLTLKNVPKPLKTIAEILIVLFCFSTKEATALLCNRHR